MKVSIKYYVLSIMGLSLFLLNTCYLIPNTASASESSPSAEIKVKLEELKREIASKAAKLKLEVDKKLKDKVFIGKIKNISENTLMIDTRNGPKTINMNQDTLFGSDTNLKYAKKLLEKEDYIAGLGDVDDTGALTAKKIVLLPARYASASVARLPKTGTVGQAGGPTPNSQLKTYLWGQIIAVTDKLVTLKDRGSKNTAVSIPDQSSVKVSNFVILTGSKGKNDIFEAEFVYVIPQGGIIKPKKIATNSAKIASPSATPH